MSCLFLPVHSCYDLYSLLSKNYETHAFYSKHFWYFCSLRTRNIEQELQIALDCTPKLFTVDLINEMHELQMERSVNTRGLLRVSVKSP